MLFGIMFCTFRHWWAASILAGLRFVYGNLWVVAMKQEILLLFGRRAGLRHDTYVYILGNSFSAFCLKDSVWQS